MGQWLNNPVNISNKSLSSKSISLLDIIKKIKYFKRIVENKKSRCVNLDLQQRQVSNQLTKNVIII